jgi:hypothetical protein
MSPDEYSCAIGLVMNAARIALVVPSETVAQLRQAIEVAEVLGPVVDPTLYRQRMHDLSTQRQVVDAFAAFRKQLDAIQGELLQRAGRGD